MDMNFLNAMKIGVSNGNMSPETALSQMYQIFTEEIDRLNAIITYYQTPATADVATHAAESAPEPVVEAAAVAADPVGDPAPVPEAVQDVVPTVADAPAEPVAVEEPAVPALTEVLADSAPAAE